ncbi:MAG: DUF2249 domain-containing protein [Acidimicrobiia bacterium]
METLDVRPLEPAARHPAIFARIDALESGETLRLVNDHDPVPLRHQLDATRPGHFRWDAVETGPEVWSADITSRARSIDVRPIIAAGDEPFGRIMAKVDELEDDEVLVVIAPFDPKPLEAKLADRGFAHKVDQIESGDFCVTFERS